MNERKTVLQTILIATIAFALALGAALCFAAAAEKLPISTAVRSTLNFETFISPLR